MRTRLAYVEFGLKAAIAIGFVSATAAASAQTWTDSPPWKSEARAMTIQVLPPAAHNTPAAATHTSGPRHAAAGGPVSPSAVTPGPQPLLPALPPSTSTWQTEPKPKKASLEISKPPATVTGRRIVAFAGSYPPGSLVIVNRERALYHVGPDGKATRYPVAIGTFTEEWTGIEFVTDKKVNPTWHPVQEPGKEPREPVQGGDPANPLGPRALYLGRTLWRIHGTPAADSIGQAVSNGCIRMHNDHVIELFEKVMLGTEVFVIDRLADAAPGHRGKKVID